MAWEEVGKRIVALRCGRNLTQAQFGRLVGISGQYVGKVERGRSLSVNLITAICRETGVSADYLLFGADGLEAIGDPLEEFSRDQIDIGFDIIKRLADFIKTENGNELLIKEIMRRQRSA